MYMVRLQNVINIRERELYINLLDPRINQLHLTVLIRSAIAV